MTNYKQENPENLEEKCDLQPSGLLKLKKSWEEASPKEKFKRLAWSVAASCAIESGEDAVKSYNKMLERYFPGVDESYKTY